MTPCHCFPLTHAELLASGHPSTLPSAPVPSEPPLPSGDTREAAVCRRGAAPWEKVLCSQGVPRPPLRDLATHHRSDAASERLSGRTLWERRGNRAREETSLASGQSGARFLKVLGGGGLVWCLEEGAWCGVWHGDPKLRALTQPSAPPAWSFPARGYVRGRGRASWKPPGPPRRNRDPM